MRQQRPTSAVAGCRHVAGRVQSTVTRMRIGLIPWFPLAAGDLAKPGSLLDSVAKAHGATQSQIALAWVRRRSPVMLLIPGTSKVAHLEENVAAAGITLSDEDFAALGLTRRGRRSSGRRRSERSKCIVYICSGDDQGRQGHEQWPNPTCTLPPLSSQLTGLQECARAALERVSEGALDKLTFEAFPGWAKSNLAFDIEDKPVRAWVETNLRTFRSSVETHPCFVKLQKLVAENQAKGEHKSINIINPSIEINVKTFDSIISKCFRVNVLNNRRFPNEPESGWLVPHNMLTRINDLIRTTIVCRHIDEPQRIAEIIKIFAREDGIGCRVDAQA